MEEAGAPGRGGEEPWTSPSRVTKRVPDAEGARDPHGPGSWTFEASKATQRSAGARLLGARGECASSSAARSSRNGLQARPTSAIAVFPGFGGKGPEAPSPSAPPPRASQGAPTACPWVRRPPGRVQSPDGPSSRTRRPSRATLGQEAGFPGPENARTRKRGGGAREDAGLSPAPKQKVTRGGNVAEAAPRRPLRPDPAEGPAEILAVRPCGPQPCPRAAPDPMQPASVQHSSPVLRAPPSSEPPTWPQGRPDHPPPRGALKPQHARLPGQVSSPTPLPLWSCSFRGPDRLRAGEPRAPPQRAGAPRQAALLARSGACGSRVVGRPSAR